MTHPMYTGNLWQGAKHLTTEHEGKASAAQTAKISSMLLSALSSHGSCGTMSASAINVAQFPPVPTALEPKATRRWVLR